MRQLRKRTPDLTPASGFDSNVTSDARCYGPGVISRSIRMLAFARRKRMRAVCVPTVPQSGLAFSAPQQVGNTYRDANACVRCLHFSRRTTSLKNFFIAIIFVSALVLANTATSLGADYPSPVPVASPTPVAPTPPPVPTAPPTPEAPAMPPMNFGSPPSGEVPILFNDHHVYANPDTLRQGRVLAALVKNGVLMVPLRSMFEQMGATVSFDRASKSVKASKTGSEVQVTLGKNEVLINGESRPLDVPPMMYKGVLLVPIRVISEALGAYVQWVPEQHLAVVRYLPPTPVPTPPPAATPVATPVPTPAPKAPSYVAFLQGGATMGRVSNEYAANVQSKGASYVAAGAYLFDKFAVKVDWRQDTYVTSNNAPIAGAPFTMFTTIDGGSATVPQFTARQSTLDGRLEYQIFSPKVYLAASYIQASNHYGNPSLTGIGGGLEKLPDFTGGLGWCGASMFYPNVRGQYTVPTGPAAGTNFTVAYNIYKYDLGID